MATYITVTGGTGSSDALLARNRADAETNRLRRIEDERDAATEADATEAKAQQDAEGNPADRPSNGGGTPGGTTPGGTTPTPADGARRPGAAFMRRDPVLAKPGANPRAKRIIYWNPTERDLRPLGDYDDNFDGGIYANERPWAARYDGYNTLQGNKKPVPYLIATGSESVPFFPYYSRSRKLSLLEGGGVSITSTASSQWPDPDTYNWVKLATTEQDEEGLLTGPSFDNASVGWKSYTIEWECAAGGTLRIICYPFEIIRENSLWTISVIFQWPPIAELTHDPDNNHIAISASDGTGARFYIGGVHVATHTNRPQLDLLYPTDTAFLYEIIASGANSNTLMFRRLRVTPKQLYRGERAVYRWP